MITNGPNFFKKIYSEDILYHYTKTSAAIDYILYNEQLKFNGRHNSIDPTESSKVNRSTVSTGYYVDKKMDRETALESNNLDRLATNLENLFCQICFCKNHMGKEFASQNYHSNFKGNEEIFGFTKPRMWEQYADNYLGLCIAFSKEKILALNNKKNKLISGDIDYLKYNQLAIRKVDYISGNYLSEVGFDKYKDCITEITELSFFCKHIDYAGENEFRIGTYYEKNKCCAEEIRGALLFDKNMMLDITGCVEAIFISSYSNAKQKKSLLEYANKLNVPIIEMIWKHDSFEPNNYRESKEIFDKILTVDYLKTEE